MERVTESGVEQMYVDSLRWRREDLRGKLEVVGLEMASLARNEAELKQQMRAVEHLLAASGVSNSDANGSLAVVVRHTDAAASVDGRAGDAHVSSLDFSEFGPKSRAIYAAAARVISEAGVPLHYRVLAEEVQKRVPLSGVDPGATLIAHLQRAKDLFPRVGRGVYGLQGMATDSGASAKLVPASGGQRSKTRRRTR